VRALRKVEIETALCFENTQCIRVHFVLENKLLKEQKGALVVYSLSNLHNGVPRIFGHDSVALFTHLVGDHKVDNKDLLKNCVVEDLRRSMTIQGP